jgi:hypothetical protein
MNKEDVLASTAVLVLAGVLAYLGRNGLRSANAWASKEMTMSAKKQRAGSDIASVYGGPSAFVNGPAIYVANTPWLFQAPIGNTIPPTAASGYPGAGPSDYIGDLGSSGGW